MFEMNEEETNVHLGSSPETQPLDKENLGQVFGVLGIMLINGEGYMAVITQIVSVASVYNLTNKHAVYLI